MAASLRDDTQEDLPMRAIWIGLGVIVCVGLLFWAAVPIPKLFARSGEDRSKIEPADPRVHAYYVKAQNGDADAMNALASWYLQSQGDGASAVKWFTESAKLHNVLAMHNLGMMYMYGQGVGCNEGLGCQFFQVAAQAGYAASMIQLATCYANGRGVGANRSQAVFWLRQAATVNDNSIRMTAMDLLRQLGE